MGVERTSQVPAGRRWARRFPVEVSTRHPLLRRCKHPLPSRRAKIQKHNGFRTAELAVHSAEKLLNLEKLLSGNLGRAQTHPLTHELLDASSPVSITGSQNGLEKKLRSDHQTTDQKAAVPGHEESFLQLRRDLGPGLSYKHILSHFSISSFDFLSDLNSQTFMNLSQGSSTPQGGQKSLSKDRFNELCQTNYHRSPFLFF